MAVNYHLSEPQSAPLISMLQTLVQQHWDATHSALLFSSLGNTVRNQYPSLYAYLAAAGGLREFIDSNQVAQIVVHPKSSQKIGAVPNGVKIPPDDIESFFAPSTRTGPRNLKLWSDFWRAFFVPMNGRRFVVVAPGARPQIVDGADSPPPNSYEILGSDLVDPATPVFERPRSTRERILQWLAQHNLDIEPFVDKDFQPAIRNHPQGHHSSNALPNECHGVPHPTGTENVCYLNGRFRFGVALYRGHHYDVRSANGGSLNCTLVDCDGRERNMGPERRRYINIFPNDHLLPERTK